MRRCLALFAMVALGGLLLSASGTVRAEVKLADYKTEHAVKSVETYSTGAGTKKDADEFLKDVGTVIDIEKVKKGEGLEFKDGKLKWELPLADKAKPTPEETKKATEAATKLLTAALAAEKDAARALAADDQLKVLTAKSVGLKGVAAGPALPLDKFDTKIAKQTVAEYLKNAALEDIAGLSTQSTILDVPEIKKYPNVTVAGEVLTWKLQFVPGTTGVDDTFKKSIEEGVKPILKAALMAEKGANRLSDADIEKVLSKAKIEPAALPKEIDAETFLEKHLKACVTAYLAENKDALKDFEDLAKKKVIDLDALAKMAPPVELTFDATKKRPVWYFLRQFRKEPLTLKERKDIAAKLRALILAAAKAEKEPARKLSPEMLEVLAKRLTEGDSKSPLFQERFPDTPLGEWAQEDVQAVVRAFLSRRNSLEATNQALEDLLTKLDRLGVAVNTAKEIEDLVYGLSYTKGGTPTFNWGYYARPDMGDMTETRKADIAVELKKVLSQAFALPQSRTDKRLSLSQADKEAVQKIIDDEKKTVIEFRSIKEIKDINARDIKEMLDDYLNQKNAPPEVAEKVARLKELLRRTLRYDLLLNDANMTLTPGKDDAKFAWKVQAALPKAKLSAALVDQIKEALVDALAAGITSPTRTRYANMPADIRNALVKAMDAADITVLPSELEDLVAELNDIRGRLTAAEGDIDDLKAEVARLKGEQRRPAPGPQYVTKTVQIPFGIFGCRSRTVTTLVPVGP